VKKFPEITPTLALPRLGGGNFLGWEDFRGTEMRSLLGLQRSSFINQTVNYFSSFPMSDFSRLNAILEFS
jgi:hypothetical protein